MKRNKNETDQGQTSTANTLVHVQTALQDMIKDMQGTSKKLVEDMEGKSKKIIEDMQGTSKKLVEDMEGKTNKLFNDMKSTSITLKALESKSVYEIKLLRDKIADRARETHSLNNELHLHKYDGHSLDEHRRPYTRDWRIDYSYSRRESYRKSYHYRESNDDDDRRSSNANNERRIDKRPRLQIDRNHATTTTTTSTTSAPAPAPVPASGSASASGLAPASAQALPYAAPASAPASGQALPNAAQTHPIIQYRQSQPPLFPNSENLSPKPILRYYPAIVPLRT